MRASSRRLDRAAAACRAQPHASCRRAPASRAQLLAALRCALLLDALLLLQLGAAARLHLMALGLGAPRALLALLLVEGPGVREQGERSQAAL